MLTGKDLRFTNVVFFFVIGVLAFGMFYQHLYILHPEYFHYLDPLVVPGATIRPIGFWTKWLFGFDFDLYSACTAVAVSYPRIVSASAVVSLFNVFEVVSKVGREDSCLQFCYLSSRPS
jgi:hypothetical protein